MENLSEIQKNWERVQSEKTTEEEKEKSTSMDEKCFGLAHYARDV